MIPLGLQFIRLLRSSIPLSFLAYLSHDHILRQLGNTILVIASIEHHGDVVKVLLEAGANKEAMSPCVSLGSDLPLQMGMEWNYRKPTHFIAVMMDGM